MSDPATTIPSSASEAEQTAAVEGLPSSASEAEPTATVEGLPSSASAAEPTAAVQAPPATYRGRRIQQLERERDELREALHTVLVEGKSYTLSNSHGVTRADVPEIEARLAAVTEELAELMMRRQFSTLRREPTKFY